MFCIYPLFKMYYPQGGIVFHAKYIFIGGNIYIYSSIRW